MDRIGTIAVYTVIATLTTLLVMMVMQRVEDVKQRREFMAECSKDMKAYECALQWRSLDK